MADVHLHRATNPSRAKLFANQPARVAKGIILSHLCDGGNFQRAAQDTVANLRKRIETPGCRPVSVAERIMIFQNKNVSECNRGSSSIVPRTLKRGACLIDDANKVENAAARVDASSMRNVEPWEILRQIKVPPRRPEDNNDVSKSGRNKAHHPSWSEPEQFLEQLEAQATIDPDSIFGSRVPSCRLDAVFPDKLYRSAAKSRPDKCRKRGSSAYWLVDGLKSEEVAAYKQIMGQRSTWKLRECDGNVFEGHRCIPS